MFYVPISICIDCPENEINHYLILLCHPHTHPFHPTPTQVTPTRHPTPTHVTPHPLMSPHTHSRHPTPTHVTPTPTHVTPHPLTSPHTHSCHPTPTHVTPTPTHVTPHPLTSPHTHSHHLTPTHLPSSVACTQPPLHSPRPAYVPPPAADSLKCHAPTSRHKHSRWRHHCSSPTLPSRNRRFDRNCAELLMLTFP